MNPAARITRPRLASQFLTTPGPSRASDVVRTLLAVQAQDYAGAKWALAQRTAGVTDADVERELNQGRILRTHLMRPTWHFVSPKDIRWLLALTAPRVTAAMASYNRKLELTTAVFRRSNDAIAKALAGGKHLTRAELKASLERARIGPLTPQRLGHLMMQAELDGVACSGPMRGKQFTYALLDERAPQAPRPARDEALQMIALRYFATRGPATVHDFAWWSGLSMSDARRAIEIAGKALKKLMIEGRPMWTATRARVVGKKRSAHLIPNYDEYFIGFKDRGAIGVRIGSTTSVTGGNALINHIVLVDGQVVGGWKRLSQGTAVVVELDLPVPLTRAERARISAAARRLERFLGVPVVERVR